MNYLYHIARKGVVGTHIVPLTTLKTVSPKHYEWHMKQYDTRKEVLRIQIPPLKCLWNDVVFLMAVHPQEILEAYTATGGVLHKRRFYRFDAATLDHSNMVVWPFDEEGDGIKKRFIPFDLADMPKYSKLPERTRQYYKAKMPTQSPQNPVLMFAYVPHILLKGTLDISTATIIEV